MDSPDPLYHPAIERMALAASAQPDQILPGGQGVRVLGTEDSLADGQQPSSVTASCSSNGTSPPKLRQSQLNGLRREAL
jgi:hypothetical protein